MVSLPAGERVKAKPDRWIARPLLPLDTELGTPFSRLFPAPGAVPMERCIAKKCQAREQKRRLTYRETRGMSKASDLTLLIL